MANQSYTSYQPDVTYDQANLINFAMNQRLLNINTILPCKILAINNNLFDIIPIINGLDVQGNSIPPISIHDVPAMQIIGGNAGLILNYVVDDVVLTGFCQRDISKVKHSWSTQNPNSLRKFSLSDGIIIGKLTNNIPTTFIKINDNEIIITTPNNITLNGKEINSNASTSFTVDSPDINLGTNGLQVLTTGTQFTVTVTGVQAGGDTATGTATVVSGTSSSVVKAKM